MFESNFEYLNNYYPQLAKLGSAAECYLYSDPNACIYKLGLLSETIVNAVFDIEKSMAKINSKIDQYAMEKKQKEIGEQVKVEKVVKEVQEKTPAPQNSSRIYNSYKSL